MDAMIIDEELLNRLITDAVKSALSTHLKKEPEGLWSRKQAADYLGVKEQTLAVMATQGRGPAVTKIGTRAVYRPEVVRKYAEDNTLSR